ncbi:MAG: hypothetical protein AB8B64_05895 [Granulosicoccus sp.]
MNTLGVKIPYGSSLVVPERCRPGLRYGAAPERTVNNTASSSLLRSLVACVPGAIRMFAEQKFAQQYYERLVARIAELNSSSPQSRAITFTKLRKRISCSGYDEELSLEALAHACVAADNVLGLAPREGQCRAAMSLLFGLFVEMPTGEGKTLATALAAAVTALDGTPVHVLTANDYLAERDASLLAPFYTALGLSSGFVKPEMNESAKHRAYACDITHLTGKQAGFDWMRDALSSGPNTSPLVTRLGSLANPKTGSPTGRLQRGLCVGILDEADSMLLDEARTPLVLAAPMLASAAFENEASIALALAQMLSQESDFQLRRETREVVLTDIGTESLAHYAEKVPGAWRATRYRNERVRQALIVLHLYQRDHDYVVRDDQVILVDEQSGRALPDRRLQNGLHSLLELKEHCIATPENETVASIAFQSFFLRYVRLVGTSGTLEEVESELSQTYDASMVCVPAEKPSRLTILPARVLASHAEQFEALIVEVRGAIAKQRPVLIGTRSVEQSRAVSAMLLAYGFEHSVLDASQDQDEARIIAKAGQLSRITVATNMAGRGTDIPLGDGVSELGGLHLISIAFNDVRRIDRQLIGRTARQGDPGSFRQLWALDDKTLKTLFPRSIKSCLSAFCKNGEYTGVSRVAVLLTIRFTQRRIERRQAVQRKLALAARKDVVRNIALDAHPEHPV